MKKDPEVRFLAEYVKQKLEGEVEDIRVDELKNYFDETGWVLYEMDTMATNIKEWRKSKSHRRREAKTY